MNEVYQKFYSAINSLSNISTNNDFIDNISAIDVFLSELRNITFIIQKKYNDKKSREIYNKLNEKYLKNDSIMKSLVDFRNETTKEHPFDLIVDIDCIVYLDKKLKMNILKFNVSDKNISTEIIEKKVEELLKSLKCRSNEIYFSYDCHFLSDNKNIDIIEYAKHGMNTIHNFLLEFEKAICNNKNECNDIKEKILTKIQKFYINELTFNTNCVYLKQTEEIKVSPKARFIGETQDKKVINKFGKIPLENDELLLKGNNLNDRFKSFILSHIALVEVTGELKPTFILIYNDNTYTIESFPIFNKAELYYIADELSSRIKKEDINAIFIVQEMIGTNENIDKFRKMTHDEKMANYNKEFIAFSMMSSDSNLFIAFDKEKISDMKYVKKTINQFKSNFTNYIFIPLIQEFQKN